MQDENQKPGRRCTPRVLPVVSQYECSSTNRVVVERSKLQRVSFRNWSMLLLLSRVAYDRMG